MSDLNGIVAGTREAGGICAMFMNNCPLMRLRESVYAYNKFGNFRGGFKITYYSGLTTE